MSGALTRIGPCQRCGHYWQIDVSTLGERDLVGYKDGARREVEYRVPCPQCGTWHIITLRVKEGPGHGGR